MKDDYKKHLISDKDIIDKIKKAKTTPQLDDLYDDYMNIKPNLSKTQIVKIDSAFNKKYSDLYPRSSGYNIKDLEKLGR